MSLELLEETITEINEIEALLKHAKARLENLYENIESEMYNDEDD